MHFFPKNTFGKQRTGGRGLSASSPLSCTPPAGNREQCAGAGSGSSVNSVMTAKSFLSQSDDATGGSSKASTVPASPPPIHRNQSLPSKISSGGYADPDDFLDIKRSDSVGLFMRKSAGDKKKISKQRALELNDIFEQSDSRDTQLNKLSSTSVKLKITEYTATPSLKMISVKEAAALYATKTELAERARMERHPNGDPLQRPLEKKSKERLETQNKRKEKLKNAKGSSDDIYSRELRSKAKMDCCHGKPTLGILQEGESLPKSVTNGPVISSPFAHLVDENGDPQYSSGLFPKKIKAIKVTAAPSLLIPDPKDAASKFHSLHGKQSDLKSKDKGMVWKPFTLSLGHELC